MAEAEKISVLIADDDDDTRQLLNEYLGNMGLKADIAADGKRALELLGCKEYDFVFLDCNMPEITGLELARFLKGRAQRPKIVMITGYGPIDEGFAKAVGVDVYMKKPLLLEDIKRIVRGGYDK